MVCVAACWDGLDAAIAENRSSVAAREGWLSTVGES